ncbi:MAG: hypothetical protein Fur002_26160 [Anaerolineales bacterium]
MSKKFTVSFGLPLGGSGVGLGAATSTGGLGSAGGVWLRAGVSLANGASVGVEEKIVGVAAACVGAAVINAAGWGNINGAKTGRGVGGAGVAAAQAEMPSASKARVAQRRRNFIRPLA